VTGRTDERVGDNYIHGYPCNHLKTMKRKAILACAMFSLIAIQGCATKHYGRQGELTAFERDSLSCREIELETAKVDGFIKQVDTESRFSGRDVLAILGDFGIGNSLERSAAIDSAIARHNQLDALRVAKGCGPAQPSPVIDRVIEEQKTQAEYRGVGTAPADQR
jgi:hypothetical protein